MRLKHYLLSFSVVLMLMGSVPAWAVDNWKPRVKDDFDINQEEHTPQERFKQPPSEEPEAKEAPETKPEPAESKPTAKTYKDLKSTPVKLQDGSATKFDKVVIFSCENIAKKRFLFNKKQSDYCLIKDVKDAALIAEKIGIDSFKKKSSVFEMCPEKSASQKACDPKQVRNF